MFVYLFVCSFICLLICLLVYFQNECQLLVHTVTVSLHHSLNLEQSTAGLSRWCPSHWPTWLMQSNHMFYLLYGLSGWPLPHWSTDLQNWLMWCNLIFTCQMGIPHIPLLTYILPLTQPHIVPVTGMSRHCILTYPIKWSLRCLSELPKQPETYCYHRVWVVPRPLLLVNKDMKHSLQS